MFGLTDWTRNGSLAEYTAVEARNLAPLAADIDHSVAAALPISGLIGSGHSAGEAEEWLAQSAAWSVTDREVLDDFGQGTREVVGQSPAEHRELGTRPRPVDRRVGGLPRRRRAAGVTRKVLLA
ncbi:hypothetical protein [Micromonospora sp. NPDC005305]|uniref:hypothetical protein n=1 Tax=Micromonospora sp. NPDC005305 TaxID=3156875 RepID=UPI0033A92775